MRIFSAEDFGAKGDGKTDDTAAIQAALDAAHDAGGGVVHLSGGTYIVSGSGKASAGALRIESNVTLAGDGMGDTVIKLADGSSEDITGILRTPSSRVTDNVTIRDLTIDGNRDNTSGEVDGLFTGVAPGGDTASHDITIEGVEIRNVSRYGFDPHEQTERLTIVDSVAHDNGKDGFTLDYISYGVLANNESYNNGRHGFNLVTSSHDVLMVDNTAHDNQSTGLVVQNGSEERAWVDDVVIAGGEYRDNALQGVLVKLSTDVTVTGASIHHNGEDGVMVHGALGTRLTGNEIFDNSTATPGNYDGIRLGDYDEGDYAAATDRSYRVDYTTVVGNAINNSSTQLMEDGVSLESNGPRTVQISGNDFDNLAGEDVNINGESGAQSGGGSTISTAVDGTNVFDHLTGTDGDDTIEGKGGNDLIEGGDGDDTAVFSKSLDQYAFILSSAGSIIVLDKTRPGEGGDGIDVVSGVENFVFAGDALSADDVSARQESFKFAFYQFSGSSAAETFLGGTTGDVLDGGGGADRLIGGFGDDEYVLDHGEDRVVEKDGQGLDSVVSSVSVTLADHVENLELAGAAGFGRGNGLDNSITGNGGGNEIKGYAGDDVMDGGNGADTLYGYAGDDRHLGGDGDDTLSDGDGDDRLDGGAGADIMRGGGGNDAYVVDTRDDLVVEYSSGGIDRVVASVDYVLPAKVENLALAGDATKATGNSLANMIEGNSRANIIDGAGGADTLTGGEGTDTFVFAGNFGRDTITDFEKTDFLEFADSPFASFEEMTAASRQDGDDVVIDLGDGRSVTLLDFPQRDLRPDDLILA